MMYNYTTMSSCNATLTGPSLQSLCSAAQFICFMTALDNEIRKNPDISRKCKQVMPIDEPAKEYDFIVVGGGGGGAVVAGRLAEMAQTTNWKILVIEAGGKESGPGHIPSFWENMLANPTNWNYHTSNESHACLSTNGSCYWPSGKSLGGNTAINGMLYLRGSPTDFNKWAELGNNGWGYDDVLTHFKKQEDNANINEVGYDYHATGGQLPVGFFPYTYPKFTESLLKASEQSGIGISKDLNGKKLTGFAIVQATQKNGVRISSSAAYLEPNRDNKNLDILLNSQVTKIIIEKNMAVGVVYVKDGKHKCVRATKEVVIAAGALRSPQLLLLSGIGPKEHLESHGIEAIADLPGVGGNLKDHPSIFMNFTMNDADTYENNVQVAKAYLKNQTGPLSTPGVSYLVGSTYTNKSTSEHPDIRILISGYRANCAPGKVGALRSNGRRQMIFGVSYVHPKSRGRISLASNNSSDYPVIRSNLLCEKSDLDGLIDGIKIVMDLVQTEALRKYNFTLSDSPLEACSNYTTYSRDYWACTAQQKTATFSHWVGTCKMGPASDPMAVVDPKLRVYGIRNLRVADASIMPEITSANTGAPTMMIGERASDFISETWLSSHKQPENTMENCDD